MEILKYLIKKRQQIKHQNKYISKIYQTFNLDKWMEKINQI